MPTSSSDRARRGASRRVALAGILGVVAVATIGLASPARAAVAGAQLKVAMSTTTPTVEPGDTATYRVTVENEGGTATLPVDEPAVNVSLHLPVPTNTLNFTTAPSSDWTCGAPTGSPAEAVCTTPLIAEGETLGFVDVSVTINPATDPATTAEVTAHASVESTTEPADNTDDNAASIDFAVQPAPDVELTLTRPDGASDTVVPGGGAVVQHVVTVENHGDVGVPDAAFSIAVAGGAIVEGDDPEGWSCEPAADAVTCTHAEDIIASASAAVAFDIAPVQDGETTELVATATLATLDSEVNADTTNDSAELTTTIAPSADLAVAVGADATAVSEGDAITFAGTVVNAGPSDAFDAALTTNVPADTTFVSFVGPEGWTCGDPSEPDGTIQCDIDHLPPTAGDGSDAGTWQLVVTADAPSNEHAVTNDSSVASSTDDPSSGNDDATVTVGVGQYNDLAVSAGFSSSPAAAGDTVTLTTQATSSGPDDALEATVTNAIPAGTSLEAIDAPDGWTCTSSDDAVPSGSGTVTCDIDAFAAGTVASFAVTVRAAQDAAGPIDHTATIASATDDPDLANNESSSAVAIERRSDLVLDMSGPTGPVAVGGLVTYHDVVTNNGPSDAWDVWIDHLVPDHTTLESFAGPGGWECFGPEEELPFVSCYVASFAAGTTVTLDVTVRVDAVPQDDPTITSFAVVDTYYNGATSEPTPDDNGDAVTTAVGQPAPPTGGGGGGGGATTTTTTSTTTTTAPPRRDGDVTSTGGAAAAQSGYWMLDRAGTVYAFGDATDHGDATVATAVDIEPTPTGLGYWIVDSRGIVVGLGDARSLGAAPTLAGGETVTSMSATPTGAGYWLFTTSGRAFAYGDAPKLGDLGALTLNAPIRDSVATPSGRGYYLVGADGGIFTFGDARFRGSMGGRVLNAPVESLVPDPDGVGYWLVAADGGVFAFNATFRGSMGGRALNAPITGMVAFGNGYLMVAADGGVFTFSDRPFDGSLGSNPPAQPIVAIAALD